VPPRTAKDHRIRPLKATDLDSVAELSAAAFGNDLSDEASRRSWTDRLAHPFATDPDGAFVAERDGRPVGLAQAIRRERVWILSMLAVDPELQSAGAGRSLLKCALGYGAGCDAGLICSSNDPRALRLYRLAGFSLRPAFAAKGRLDRRTLPPADPAVREADERDLDAIEAISREVRGGPHTSELAWGLGRGMRVLRLGDRGFAAVRPGVNVWMLAARDTEAAQTLLWPALELVGDLEEGQSSVRWITGGQDWAMDVVLRAGYALEPSTALCVRGQPGTLHPFVPSPPFA